MSLFESPYAVASPPHQGPLGQFNDLAEKLPQHECTLAELHVLATKIARF